MDESAAPSGPSALGLDLSDVRRVGTRGTDAECLAAYLERRGVSEAQWNAPIANESDEERAPRVRRSLRRPGIIRAPFRAAACDSQASRERKLRRSSP